MRSRTGVAALAAGALLAGGAGLAQAETITTSGLAQVMAPAPLTNAKITRAVAVAREKAIPIAFAVARNQAVRLGEVAGLAPGAITAIEEGNNSPYGFYGNPFNTGRFGPGQYCGYSQQIRRGPRVNGRRGPVISRRRVFRCYKPSAYVVAFTVTYEATPTQRPA